MYRQGEIRPGPPPLVPDNESRWDKLPGPPPLVPDKITYDEWYRLSRSLQCQICTSPWEPCRPTGVCTRCHRTMCEMCFNAHSPGLSLAGKEMGQGAPMRKSIAVLRVESITIKPHWRHWSIDAINSDRLRPTSFIWTKPSDNQKEVLRALWLNEALTQEVLQSTLS